MKKINLRKASAAVQILMASVASLRQEVVKSGSLNLSIFGDYDKYIDENRAKFQENQKKLSDQTDVLFSIRKKVSEANQSNVDTILNSIAKIDAQISNIAFIADGYVSDKDIVTAKIAMAKEKVKSDSYGYGSEEVAVSIFTKEDTEKASKELSELKRTKRKLQDDLLSANIEDKISLTTKEVEILEDLGVI